ncbi:MAG: sodium:proton antiporter [Gammaproteobacteria bacterium]|nr:sodium:proton antiporter [Gammaproteobacteria bacterium]
MNRISSVVLLLLLASLALILGLAVISLAQPSSGIGQLVNMQMSNSGVDHPVTAVLLNFRGYDTLLEMAVLLLAVIAVWSLGSRSSPQQTPSNHSNPILLALFRMLTPLMIVVAGYLLWVGAHAPGGAFQAGSILAAAGVLALLYDQRLAGRLSSWSLRFSLILGCAMFVAVATGVMLGGAHLLQYPLPWAGSLILLIELAATISIGLTLTALFYGTSTGERP